MSKLYQLQEMGQSVWLDFISRDLVESGELNHRVNQGLRGITSNPKIFDQAISEGDAYDPQLAELANAHANEFDSYEAIVIKDIQTAADSLRPIYDKTEGQDGYVSLEVDPHLAYETNLTIEEVQRLYERVGRPNVMFKVPATEQGVFAVRRLTLCARMDETTSP